jgi:predicted HTH domain antitoxin
MMVGDLIIPKDILQRVKMTPDQLTLEIAVYLYAKKKLTLGQAKRLAGLDQLAFQEALAKRQVNIHYDMADVKKDIENLGIQL